MALIKCKECGKEFSSLAAACPNCGYSPLVEKKRETESELLPIEQRKNKITAGILCLFLFGFGAHAFYLGRVGQAIAWIFGTGILGILSLSFFPPLAFILWLIPLTLAIKLWVMPTERFDLKYNNKNSPKSRMGCLLSAVVCMIIMFLLFVAMAMPAYFQAVERARMQDRINAQY